MRASTIEQDAAQLRADAIAAGRLSAKLSIESLHRIANIITSAQPVAVKKQRPKAAA